MSHKSLFEGGFGPVMLPVIPPSAPIAPGSTVTDPGKTPGKLTGNGWVGVNLKKTECATLKEAETRDGWGASVGFACGRLGLVGLDNDIGDPAINDKVRALLYAHGIGYVLRGVFSATHNKELYLFRVVEDVTGEPIEIASKDIRLEYQGAKTAIQILGAGKQFVVEGTHVSTGQPYFCSPALTTFDDLPMVAQPVFDVFIQALQAELPGWGCKLTSNVQNLAKGRAARYEGQQAQTEQELREWLALVPNTLADFPGRDEWVEMLYAIYGASDGLEWGRNLWLEWCDAVQQQPGLPEAYWDRIDPKEVRSGMGFIRHKARQKAPGRAAQLDFQHVPDIDPELLEQAAKTSNLWPILKRRFVYMTSISRFVDTFTGQDMSPEALDLQMLSKAGTLAAQINATGPAAKSFTRMLMGQDDRTVVETQSYHPGRPRIMDGEHDTLVFNRWRPGFTQLRPNTTRAHVQPWIDLVTHVCGDPASAEQAIKWWAFVVQYPDRKPNWHQVFISKPGIGKDMMLRPYIFAIGQRNTAMIGSDELTTAFNEYLEKRAVIANEMKQRGGGGGKTGHDVANELKKYLTAPPDTITVNRKGLRPYEIPNLTAWTFLSNEDNPIYVSEGDRRLWIVDNRAANKLAASEYDKLAAWLSVNMLTVATFLAEYPLTDADKQAIMGEAPMTQAKRALVALNRNPVEVAVEQIIEEARAGVGPLACGVCTMADVSALLAERGLNVGTQYVSRHLRSIPGVRPVKEDPRTLGAAAIKHKGRGLRLWLLGDQDEDGHDLTNLTTQQLADLYETKKWAFPSASVLTFPSVSAPVV